MSARSKRASHPIAFVLMALFLAVPLLGRKLNPNEYAGGRSRDVEARYQRNSSAIANMLGELRTSMSDVLFLKTERYLHSGVGYKAHINKRLMSVSGTTASNFAHQREVGSDKEHVLHDDHAAEEESSAPLIPDADNDFRGFIGDLHREVKPWLPPDAHASHTDGKEILPWFRVMTMSDPHYVRAYAVGGWWLKTVDIDEGLSFLEEGMRNNPEAFQIQATYGDLLQSKGRKISKDIFNPSPEALKYFLHSRDAYQEAAEVAITLRPENYDKEVIYPEWTNYMEDDAMAAVNMAVLLERQYGNAFKTKELAQRYLSFFPDNQTLKGVVNNAP